MHLAKRQLGSTGIAISVLGLGTVKLGRNTDVKYPQAFNIPNDKEAAELLSLAQDCGINLLDTAPAYGNSEERLGKLLRGQRQNWVIVSKAGEEYINQQSRYDFSQQAILNSIKRSLQRLHTDYLDVLLIHSDGNDLQLINNYEIFNTLDLAKQQGLIRAGGISTKTIDGGLLTIQHSDIAMVTYNPQHTEELPVIIEAHKQNKGILIKKALGSGHLPAEQAIKYILGTQGVSGIILGTINPRHLQQNVSFALN